MDSLRRGASFSCRTHVSMIHGCGTMKGLWGCCLEEGERKLDDGEGKRVYVQVLTILAHRSQRRVWPHENVPFGGIPRAWAEGALRAARWLRFGCSPGLQSMGFLLPRVWLDSLQATNHAPSLRLRARASSARQQSLPSWAAPGTAQQQVCFLFLFFSFFFFLKWIIIKIWTVLNLNIFLI
jgi:hypothetical protein